jgi:hypothetical protein
MSKADFVYMGKFSFDQLSPDIQLEFEKDKYRRGIIPQIKELEKEINKNKKETAKEKQKIFKFLMKSRKNQRTWKFQYENGDVYPKEISAPDIRYIQYAEPHVIITDWYDENLDWYIMPHLIKGFAEEAYLSYEMGLWFSSIASSINCCEYLFKYEYLRKINQTNRKKAEELSKDRHFSLGTFIHNNDNYLEQIGLKTFTDKISYLNDVRISIYHFNPERSKQVNKKGTLDVEKDTPISDEMVLPIIAYRVYMTMIEITSLLYNEHKALEYIKEGAKDWMRKRGLKEEDLKSSNKKLNSNKPKSE